MSARSSDLEEALVVAEKFGPRQPNHRREPVGSEATHGRRLDPPVEHPVLPRPARSLVPMVVTSPRCLGGRPRHGRGRNHIPMCVARGVRSGLFGRGRVSGWEQSRSRTRESRRIDDARRAIIIARYPVEGLKSSRGRATSRAETGVWRRIRGVRPPRVGGRGRGRSWRRWRTPRSGGGGRWTGRLSRRCR